MRIALVQFYSRTPTPVYDQLARVLRERGHMVVVGTPDEEGAIAWHDGRDVIGRVRGAGRVPGILSRVPILRQVLRRIRRIAFMLRLRAWIRRDGPDIVQVNKTPLCALIPAGMPRGMRFVFDVRQLGLWESGSGRARLRNARAVLRMRLNSRHVYDRACYGSAAAAERVLGSGWRRWAVATPIGVGREFVTFRAERRQAAGPVSFVYIGTLSRLRRLEVLLEAALAARTQGAGFTLTLMGPGEDKAFFAREAERLGLAGTVRVLPPVPYAEIPRAVTSHAVAVAYVPDVEDWVYQPTLKVLEYRALGMPVLASDIPSNREVVTEGVNGLLVRNTPDALAEGIIRLSSDTGLLARFSEAAGRMRSGLTWEDVAEIHLKHVYEPLIR